MAVTVLSLHQGRGNQAQGRQDVGSLWIKLDCKRAYELSEALAQCMKEECVELCQAL
jgi:hypothetical protein